MADLSFLRADPRPVAILGLGVSGKAVAEACKQANVPYHAWMDEATAREELGKTYVIEDIAQNLGGYQILVPAAGIKPSHPVLQKAKEAGVKIFSDIDLLYLSAPEATFIGITGTNGKSTTTVLTGHILAQAGETVEVGGNIGRAACSLPSLKSGGLYVLELSSYQLEITAQPVYDIAALLNITEDHLEWHGDMAHYIAAKKKIFRTKPGKAQIDVIATDTAITRQIAADLNALTDHVVRTVTAEEAPVADHPFLKGRHNAQNMAVAAEICRQVGLDEATIVKHLLTFEGLPHRQKWVGTIGKVRFVNDSKATNADATSHALAAYRNIYWILGGKPKDDGIDGLDKFYPHIRKAFLIGEAQDRFAVKLDGALPYEKNGTMARAVRAAFAAARQSDEEAVVLLSPACASFDQYKNFEQRGDDFERLAQEIIKQEAA